MKRILSLSLSLLLLLSPAAWPAAASAEGTAPGGGALVTPESTLDAQFLFGDLFSDRGKSAEPAESADKQPGQTPGPALDAGALLDLLFSSLLGDGEQTSDSAPTPEPTPQPTPEPAPRTSSALFPDGVREISSDSYGGKVDFAYVNGWTVSRGYFDGRYCITGIPFSGAERVMLVDGDPMGFVPAGDAIVYFGEGTKGDYGWLSLVPGERRPFKLPLDALCEVFYADGKFLWYYTPGSGNSTAIGRIGLDGSNKKKLGTVSGHVVSMMPGEQVLLVNFDKNVVRLWKDGEYETLYSPDEEILSVTSGGMGIWIEHADGYGPLMDGKVTFRLPGRIMQAFGTTDQLALLVLPYEDSEFLDVYLFNEIYRAYAGVGRVKRSDSTTIELAQDRMIVWGPEESVLFEYPIPEIWLPYGYYDYASAENFLSDEGWMQLLVGSWCAEPAVGSGYAERLVFTQDDLYRLPAQEGNTKAKMRQSDWFVVDGYLFEYDSTYEPRLLWLSGPFTVSEEAGPYSPMIFLDGVAFYQYSSDPAYFDDLDAYGVRVESSIGSPKTNGETVAPLPGA